MKDKQRVIWWRRSENRATLRAIRFSGLSPRKSTAFVFKTLEEAKEPASGTASAARREIPRRPRPLSDVAASSLAVWTLWTNPQHQ